MAKKKAARAKAAPAKKAKASPKTPAKAKAKASKPKAKPVAAKAKPAKKAVAKKSAPVAAANRKPPVIAAKLAVKTAAKPATKPAKPVSIKPPAIKSSYPRSPWDLRDVVVTFSQSRYVTHFHYLRTNPEDCDVRVRYSSFQNGPLDNTITVPKDKGDAATAGRPQDWDSLEIIPTGYRVSVQLCQNFAPMTPAQEVVVQSVP